MAKVTPFHSVNSNVYHDNSKCTEGNNIERKYKKSGQGGRSKCAHCVRLSK